MQNVHQFFNGLNDEMLKAILEDENVVVHGLLRDYLEMIMKKRMGNVMKILQDSALYLTSDEAQRQVFIGT